MQIIFSNQFGCHSKSELILNYPELIDVAASEHNQALGQGWLLTIKNNNEHWYQCRSTRTKLSDTNYSKESIESVQFVWDYSNPTSHLGLNSLRHEVAWAKESGYEYFYMGAGYEKNSIYKSEIDGFEWWTGREWSKDKDEYIYLCKRDSVISSCHQIHSALASLQHDRNIV